MESIDGVQLVDREIALTETTVNDEDLIIQNGGKRQTRKYITK